MKLGIVTAVSSKKVFTVLCGDEIIRTPHQHHRSVIIVGDLVEIGPQNVIYSAPEKSHNIDRRDPLEITITDHIVKPEEISRCKMFFNHPIFGRAKLNKFKLEPNERCQKISIKYAPDEHFEWIVTNIVVELDENLIKQFDSLHYTLVNERNQEYEYQKSCWNAIGLCKLVYINNDDPIYGRVPHFAPLNRLDERAAKTIKEGCLLYIVNANGPRNASTPKGVVKSSYDVGHVLKRIINGFSVLDNT
ncbi:unnamed protein product [Caenorhabditis bovis]|uniref:Uncharacterized protein n=1 Tax=Caenorhabditis bovis TaxID=2654633 RepID=A0A8S1EJG4_9PELO|nr:unnamed protein product [Caenorhabditis bovis]